MQQNQQEHEKIFELQMKALKDGKNLTPAQLAQQLSVTPAKGAKGGGKSPNGAKGQGKDGQGGGAQNRNQSPAQGAQVCWHHNAKHHYPDGGFFCPAKIDEATGKTTCWFPHIIVSRKDFDAMPVPRSVGKSGGKGGKAGIKNPKGGRRDERNPSPGGNPKFCYDFAKTGSCKNGDQCWFAHIPQSEVAKMGITPPPAKGGKGGKNPHKGGKNAAAAGQQQQQQNNGQPVAPALRHPVDATSAVAEKIQQGQDGAAETFAAADRE